MEFLLLSDMRFVATVLTNGPVEARPNLSKHNIRLAGLLVANGTTPSIYFEKYDPLVRQRFSIAHELGHFFLHHNAQSQFIEQCTLDDDERFQESSISVPEIEADAFAGAFLMPADSLSDDLTRFGRCVSFLSARYGVSDATLRRRLHTLESLQI